MFVTRFAIYELAYGPSFSKSWRPHFLVFSRTSEEYSYKLLSFTESLSQSKSFLTLASFVSNIKINTEKRNQFSETIKKRFKELSLKLRLPLEIDVYVSPEMKNVTIQFMRTFSAEADTIFMALKQPEQDDFSKDDYSQYLKKMSKVMEEHPNIVFVLSSDHTPLDTILI